MLFCPKCGAMMTPKQDKGKRILACSCGYTDRKVESTAVKEVAPSKRQAGAVVTDDNPALPLTDETCPTCGHDRAFWWTKQTRASDEPETKFLKCEKCKHTWRERG